MNKLIINGFGRIGKAVLYQLIINKIDIKEIIINQPNLNLSKMREIILYDSIYGLFNVNISIKKDHLFVNLNGIFYTLFVTSFQNLFENSNLNLNEFKIIDCTGINYNKNYFFNIINKFKNFTLLLSYWSVSFGHIINNSFSKKLSNSKKLNNENNIYGHGKLNQLVEDEKNNFKWLF
jgi:glyceraldehyde-3-phosphate dehydrogenase/erythrose-4-phosphate dehydrogenase